MIMDKIRNAIQNCMGEVNLAPYKGGIVKAIPRFGGKPVFYRICRGRPVRILDGVRITLS